MRLVYVFFLTVIQSFEKNNFFNNVQHPSIDFDDYSSKIGFFGQFESLTFYKNYKQDTEVSEAESLLYLRDIQTDSLKRFPLKGEFQHIAKLDVKRVIIYGKELEHQGHKCGNLIIYNLLTNTVQDILKNQNIQIQKVTSLFSSDKNVFIGGSLQLNNCHGLIIYKTISNTFICPEFGGFGHNTYIDSISQIIMNDSIIDVFTGKIFLSDKRSKNDNNQNKNLALDNTETTEYKFYLNRETKIFFRSSNDSKDDSSNGTKTDRWFLPKNNSSEISITIPEEYFHIKLSKIRIYTDVKKSVSVRFRVHFHPSFGIARFSYIDPKSNKLSYCDEFCVLSSRDILSGSVKKNQKVKDDLTLDQIHISDEGDYMKFMDDKNVISIGYSSNYQDFAFSNKFSIEKLKLTFFNDNDEEYNINGVELYLDSIILFSDPKYNNNNSSVVVVKTDNNNFETFKPLKNKSEPNGNEKLYSERRDTKFDFDLNFKQNGTFLFKIITPGCIIDNTCDRRSIVKFDIIDKNLNILYTKFIHQNNNYDKIDEIHSDMFSPFEHNFLTLRFSFHDRINKFKNDTIIVINNILINDFFFKPIVKKNTLKTNLISLNDNFYGVFSVLNSDVISDSINSNNKKIHKHDYYYNLFDKVLIMNVRIVLFKYEFLKNMIRIVLFGHFDSIDYLSLKFFEFDSVNKLKKTNNPKLFTQKHFNYFLHFPSNNNENNKLIQQNEKKFKRYNSLKYKFNFSDFKFDGFVKNFFNLKNGFMFVGNFTATVKGKTVRIFDLYHQKMVTEVSNFLFYQDEKWFLFGNDHLNIFFDGFVDLMVKKKCYFIFFSHKDKNFHVWNHYDKTWNKENSNLLNVIYTFNLNNRMDVIVGRVFFMDFFLTNHAFMIKDLKITSLDSLKFKQNSLINLSYFIDTSLSVITGDFYLKSNSKISFLFTNYKYTLLTSIDDNVVWGPKSEIVSVFVELVSNLIFIGFKGQAKIHNNTYNSGIIIYDIEKKNFTETQPSGITNDDKEAVVKSMVFYNKQEKLLIGGSFNRAGITDCKNLCILNLKTLEWESLYPKGNKNVIEGDINGILFYASTKVLIYGSLVYFNNKVNFIFYDFLNRKFISNRSLNLPNSDSPLLNIINEHNNDEKKKMVLVGKKSIYGFDKTNWIDIGKDINFDDKTIIKDLKLIYLEKKTTNQSLFFDDYQGIILAGKINFRNYGLMNAAIFDGTELVPFFFTNNIDFKNSIINCMLVEEIYSYRSSAEFDMQTNFSKGKIIAISFASALTATFVLGLLYVVPYFSFIKKNIR